MQWFLKFVPAAFVTIFLTTGTAMAKDHHRVGTTLWADVPGKPYTIVTEPARAVFYFSQYHNWLTLEIVVIPSDDPEDVVRTRIRLRDLQVFDLALRGLDEDESQPGHLLRFVRSNNAVVAETYTPSGEPSAFLMATPMQ